MTTAFREVALAHLPGDPRDVDAEGAERLRAALAGAKLRAEAARAAWLDFAAERLGTSRGEVRGFAAEVPRALARAVGELLEGDPVALAEHDALLDAIREAETDARALVAYAQQTRENSHGRAEIGT